MNVDALDALHADSHTGLKMDRQGVEVPVTQWTGSRRTTADKVEEGKGGIVVTHELVVCTTRTIPNP